MLVVALGAWAPAALAEEDAATRAAARKLAEDGVAALQGGDAKTATQKLDKAYRMLKVPSVALWSGRALLKQGLLLEAMERLLEATRLASSGDVAVQDRAKADAEKEIEQLRPRIPNLVIALEGAAEAEVTLSLDGKPVPGALVGEDMPLNPGQHRLVGKRQSQEQAVDVTIAEGERKSVTLSFAGGASAAPTSGAPAASDSGPSPPAGDAPATGGKRTLAYVALAAGGAGLVLGGVSGGLALSKRSELDDSGDCEADQCRRSVEGDVSTLRTFRTLSTVGFIAGGALAATGVVLLLTTGKSADQGRAPRTRLGLGLGPGSLRLEGQF